MRKQFQATNMLTLSTTKAMERLLDKIETVVTLETATTEEDTAIPIIWTLTSVVKMFKGVN